MLDAISRITWIEYWIRRHANTIAISMLFIASFLYYSLLSAKSYTWVFTSGDSGEFMAMAHYWSAPHLYGMPLYQALSHGVYALGGDLAWNMSVLLSALPAALTIIITYLIVSHIANNRWIALVSSMVLLGAAVFTTEAQVIKEYSLAVMLLTLSFYFYIKGHKALAVISIGLGSAVHMVVVAIAVLWFLLQWRQWYKYIPLYVVFGVLPYGLTLWELSNNSPPFLAGHGLSFETINAYLGFTGIAGGLAATAAPARIWAEIRVIIISLGLALVPLFVGLNKPWNITSKMLIVAIAFPVWYYLTCMDSTTWTYLCFAMPFCAIAVGIGLQRLRGYHTQVILVGAIIMIAMNGYFLNSSRLDAQESTAKSYYAAIMDIPDGSVVTVHRGGFYGSGLFYAMSNGKDVIPVYYRYEDEKNILWWQYIDWMHEQYPLSGNSTQAMIASALEQDIEVYAFVPFVEGWEQIFDYEPYNQYFVKVTGVSNEAVYSPLYKETQ